MNEASESPVEAAPDAKRQPVLIWDLPVRVFHWLLAVSFAGAWLTAESERWRDVHVTLGYTMAGLVAFRLIWGFVGTRHARFTSFVRGPAFVARYLRSLWRGGPALHAGHNPAGALAIVALLVLIGLTGATGWATFEGIGGHVLEEAHEAIANTLLVFVAVHLVGVAVSSWLHRENLIGAMLHGRKHGSADERIRSPLRPVAALVLAAVVGFWWVQWDSAGYVATVHAARTSADAKHDPDHD